MKGTETPGEVNAALDEALLERWRAGDGAAGEALFRRYYPSIERFFGSKVTTATADLAQETFVACVEARTRIREGQRFRSYLFAVAYNVLCGHLRRRYKKVITVDIDQVSMRDLSPSPSTLIGARGRDRLLLEALRTLSLEHQVILELHYWESLGTREIADVLDLPSGTVKSRLIRARRGLRAALENLDASPRSLESTVTDLERWAAELEHDIVRRTGD